LSSFPYLFVILAPGFPEQAPLQLSHLEKEALADSEGDRRFPIRFAGRCDKS
jgi:hypothetical protein